MASKFRSPAIPFPIRDYNLALRLLQEARLDGDPSGIRILKKLKPAADRAQAKLERPPADPKKAEWDAAYDFCWTEFSLYIRTRDTRPYGDTRRGKCVTCESWFTFKELQAGHCIPTANWGTKFETKNVNGQCWPCNDKMRGNGRRPLHEAAIEVKYGIGTMRALTQRTRTHGRRWTAQELRQKGEEFRRMREGILSRETVGEAP